MKVKESCFSMADLQMKHRIQTPSLIFIAISTRLRNTSTIEIISTKRNAWPSLSLPLTYGELLFFCRISSNILCPLSKWYAVTLFLFVAFCLLDCEKPKVEDRLFFYSLYLWKYWTFSSFSANFHKLIEFLYSLVYCSYTSALKLLCTVVPVTVYLFMIILGFQYVSLSL